MSSRLAIVFILLVSGSSCSPHREDRDCYPNMALGAEYEIRVLEAWSRDSQFRWPPNTDRLVEPYPHCNGADGLRAGSSFRIRLTQRQYIPQFGTCFDYVGTPIDGITGVDFTATPRILDGVFSIHVSTPDGVNYRMQAMTLLSDPVNALAQPGESPPRLMRDRPLRRRDAPHPRAA